MQDLGFFGAAETDEPETEITEPEMDLVDEITPKVVTKKLTVSEYQSLLKSKDAVVKLYEYLFDHAELLEYHGYMGFLLKQPLSKQTLISISTIANQQYKTTSFDWNVFSTILTKVIKLFPTELDLIEARQLLIFIMNAFQSLDNSIIRKELLKYVSISIWSKLSELRREWELAKSPERVAMWKKYMKKVDQVGLFAFQNEFLSNAIQHFFKVLDKSTDKEAVLYCERFVEFLIDLEAQLPTRRFFHALLQDHQVLVHCQESKLYKSLQLDSLFHKLVNRLAFYESFEIDDITGQAITYQEQKSIKHNRMYQIQKIAFQKFPEMEEFVYASVGSMENEKALRKHLDVLIDDRLFQFAKEIGVRSESLDGTPHSREFLMACIVHDFKRHTSQLGLMNQLPLYPNETIMFDDILVPPNKTFTNSHCQPLPKLNIQFLTLHDYLYRNFQLYQIENAYAIRQDIEDAILRLNPRYNPDFVASYGKTIFGGWARMATPLHQIQIERVGEPRLAELAPSFVKADITYSLEKYKPAIRKEWDQLKQHDTLFLVSLQMMPDKSVTEQVQVDPSTLNGAEFRKKYGITHIRGCEVFELLDDAGDVVYDFERALEPDSSGEVKIGSHQRTIRVLLDPNQYYTDETNSSDIYDIYGSFNLIVRRNASQNNFKSVLESIRDLMQSELVVPDWLKEVLLGYGNRDAAHYTKMESPTQSVDFGYTFLNWDHLTESFPTKTLIPLKEKKSPNLMPPYILTFPKSDFEALAEDEEDDDGKRKATEGPEGILVKSYRPNETFYKQKANKIRFTPTQVEAIRSGSSTGLTLVVGPPGTGKTDVAVQIICNVYNQNPNSHILLITKSNQALNHLFQKISEAPINPQHLLRLGHGHEDLESGETWSKSGRINAFIEKRIELLKQCEKLVASLEFPVDHAYSCEAAEYFFSSYLQPIWSNYEKEFILNPSPKDDIISKFPFSKFIKTIKPELFSKGKDDVLELVHTYYGYITNLFAEISRMRPFELLRTNKERANYLLVKEARIIAMTTTHASIRRRELIRLGFKYDTVIMEEAGQMLEIETFIPMLLQTHDTDLNRFPLSRVVLIGDHHQLPPVIQNQAVAKYGKMDQSLFSRLIRLGVSSIHLDYQGRCRPSIADLFRWNYSLLKDIENPDFKPINPGFAFDYQAINVPDFEGKGETMPRPHFVQNLGEAEYVIATYMYMRLLGYPAEKIAILTTYNGQKELILDIMNRKCQHSLFGLCRVSTVDQFQGQQADYVLLSLVRTNMVGHLRDKRRLVVALSRGRLGLYIFCRKSVFEQCHDLKPAFDQIFNRPTHLSIVEGESFPCIRTSKQTKTFEDCIEFSSYVHQLTTKALKEK